MIMMETGAAEASPYGPGPRFGWLESMIFALLEAGILLGLWPFIVYRHLKNLRRHRG